MVIDVRTVRTVCAHDCPDMCSLIVHVNDRARVRLVLRVSDEVSPGVALVPGQRPPREPGGATVNMLCSTRYTDLGAGATYQSTRLDVRRPAAG